VTAVHDSDQWIRRIRATADIALGALLASALVIQAVAIAISWGGLSFVFGVTAGAAVCALVLIRRRDRVVTAAAGIAIAGLAIVVTRLAELPREPGAAMALALSVLVGAAVRTLAPIQAVPIAAGGLAVVAGTVWSGSAAAAPITAWNATTWAAGIAVGLWLRLLDTRRDAMAEMVRRDERMELARELHDMVAHHVTGIVVQAQAARPAIGKDLKRLDGCLTDIETAAGEALGAMRRLVGVLRDAEDAAPASGGSEQLSELVERFDDGDRVVNLQLPEDGDHGWPPEVISTVYRIVQESLTNVARHARDAQTVTVMIDEGLDGVTVEVTDDGPRSVPPLIPTGYGLVGMRERVERLGGTFAAGPRDASGWTVRAIVPITRRERR
jgi:signal transduction histidine kinase